MWKFLHILCILVFIGCIGMMIYDNSNVNVPGTIYAMNTDFINVSTGKHTSSTMDIYRIAVHPDESDKYEDYDARISFAKYASRKVGDHVVCNVSIRKYKKGFIYLDPLWFLLSIISFIFILITGITISENKSENN